MSSRGQVRPKWGGGNFDMATQMWSSMGKTNRVPRLNSSCSRQSVSRSKASSEVLPILLPFAPPDAPLAVRAASPNVRVRSLSSQRKSESWSFSCSWFWKWGMEKMEVWWLPQSYQCCSIVSSLCCNITFNQTQKPQAAQHHINQHTTWKINLIHPITLYIHPPNPHHNLLEADLPSLSQETSGLNWSHDDSVDLSIVRIFKASQKPRFPFAEHLFFYFYK